ncbi:MAG: hypothetical protein IJK89_08555 [Clostridia bacterium]|nr:hypothetical protein [Clostridia bacterium]
MKKALLIIGVIILVACVSALVFAVWNWFAYHHVLDGSAALYERLRLRMTVSFIVGGVLAAVGAVCLIVRGRL